MRGFIITAILFSIMIIVIISNTFLMNEATHNMKEAIESLEKIPCQENEVIIEQLANNWKKTSIWISLSVSYDNIEEITDMISSLGAANATSNVEQFQIHISLLLNSIDEMGRLEKISIKNIL